MTIIAATVAISAASLNRAMARVKELTPRGTSHHLEQTIEQINQWYVGWANYYSMTQYPSQLRKIEAHVRRRLRARIVDQQKSKRNLFKKLTARGVSRRLAAKQVFSNRRRWAMSHTAAVDKAYPNDWFARQGLKTMSNKRLPHWFEIRRWVKLT